MGDGAPKRYDKRVCERYAHVATPTSGKLIRDPTTAFNATQRPATLRVGRLEFLIKNLGKAAVVQSTFAGSDRFRDNMETALKNELPLHVARDVKKVKVHDIGLGVGGQSVVVNFEMETKDELEKIQKKINSSHMQQAVADAWEGMMNCKVEQVVGTFTAPPLRPLYPNPDYVHPEAARPRDAGQKNNRVTLSCPGAKSLPSLRSALRSVGSLFLYILMSFHRLPFSFRFDD
jgi:hypothetical protein